MSPVDQETLQAVRQHRVRKAMRFLRKGGVRCFGPGMLTGASDDDPSGIATYSQAGALFGLPFLWTTCFSIPFMTAIQELCARIGRITGRGIAANLRRHYPGWLLYPMIGLLAIANVINLAADLRAMGEAVTLLAGGHPLWYTVGFALLSVGLQVFVPYERYTSVLRLLALALLAYVATAFWGSFSWASVLYNTLVPHVQFTPEYLGMFIAVIGTTITPYLFFWQASLETEEIQCREEETPLRKAPEQAREQLTRIRFDTWLGMILSNGIAFCIMLTTAVAVNMNPHMPVKNLQTARQAAEALKPAAGEAAFLLFSLGIIGTGLLAVPTLAGSAAYAVGEAMRWRTGLQRKPHEARRFYAVLAAATLLGGAMNFWQGFDPIKALVWAALINGVAAVPIMAMILVMASSQRVMGKFARLSPALRTIGWVATGVMGAAVAGLFATLGR